MGLIEIDLQTEHQAMIALVLFGFIGHTLVLRWPRSLVLWLALAGALTFYLATHLIGLLHTSMTSEFVRLIIREVTFAVSAALAAIVLPLRAYVRFQSRPAA